VFLVCASLVLRCGAGANRAVESLTTSDLQRRNASKARLVRVAAKGASAALLVAHLEQPKRALRTVHTRLCAATRACIRRDGLLLASAHVQFGTT